jgi:hypothetical protein
MGYPAVFGLKAAGFRAALLFYGKSENIKEII